MNTIQRVKEEIKKEYNLYRRHHRGMEYFILRPSALSGSSILEETPFSLINFCGYVVIDKSSSYYISNNYDDYKIDCHGGLTYAGDISSVSVDFAIGFDCSHAGDVISLGLDGIFSLESNIYRNVDYVDKECKGIIDQLMSNNG
jgi:hypothetical protein